MLQPAVGSDLPVLWSYVSEMAAANRPHHTLVSALDLGAGVCILLFTCRLQRLLPGHGTARRVGIAALGVFGAATALNALWPMTCAPSLQPECAAGGLALHGPAQDLARPPSASWESSASLPACSGSVTPCGRHQVGSGPPEWAPGSSPSASR